MNRAWHLSVWGFVNVLFLVKYGARVHPLLPWAGIGCIAIGMFALVGISRFLDRRGGMAVLPWGLAVLFIGASWYCFRRIPAATLRVDRFDMIDLFWENLRAGIDPYTPRIPGVTSIPSQFPSYFLLALPFHLLGEIGWIPVASIVGFAWILWYESGSAGRRAFALSLLLFSPALWWEVVCRSTIFANSFLCLIALRPVFRRPGLAPGFLAAFFLGLVTSTRSVILQMVLPAVLPQVRFKPASWIVPGLVWCLPPLLTIAPLLVLRHQHLWNPFDVNALFLPGWIPAGLLLVSIIVASRRTDWRWTLSVALFGLDLLVATYAGIVIHEWGFGAAIFGSKLDISYLLLGSPFHLLLWADARPGQGAGHSPMIKGPRTELRESLSDQ